MTTITVDGLNEETFRRVIEGRLRQGKPTEAVEKLRALLAPYVGPERILPERFLTVQSSDLQLSGWEGLEAALARHDQPGWPITALSIAFGWPSISTCSTARRRPIGIGPIRTDWALQTSWRRRLPRARAGNCAGFR